MNQIILNNIRVQFLTDDVVRIERKHNGAFCDVETFFVPSRALDGTIEVVAHDNVITFGEYTLTLPPEGKSLFGVRLQKKGKKVYAYKRLANSGELPELGNAPEVFAISDCPRILIPQGGYSTDKEGRFTVQEDVQDVYLLLCGRDDKRLRRQYVGLTGRPELVRLASLGAWNSKYFPYNEQQAKQVILEYQKHDVPMDTLVIDTDWRSCENGWGYDINTKLFPDMRRFLRFAHSHNVEVMFNDHPEPLEGKDVFNAKEIAYREKNLQRLMKMGVDTWWYDRNWSTSLISPTSGVKHETLGMYAFYDITKHFYQKQAGGKPYRRSVIMGNVVNVVNGAYRGISDSASHRYSIQWTGDIETAAMGQEVETLIKAGNNCVTYVNSDCGGHTGNPDKEHFVRWMQFGTLSPIFRPHCACNVLRFREPWLYDAETLDIVREYTKLRYRLLPVIYAAAYNAYQTGEPIFKGLGWQYPQDKRALANTEEYMLGNNLLIRPISGKKQVKLSKQCFTKPVKATYYDGTSLQGEPIATAEYDELGFAFFGTSPEQGVPAFNFSARFETEIELPCTQELFVRYDDCATVWLDGKCVLDDKVCHPPLSASLGAVEGNKPHSLVIEYIQGGSGAELSLFCCDGAPQDGVATYLPAGKWLDPFDGKVHVSGGRTVVVKEYDLRSMPIFVRLGAVIPLIQAASTTVQQSWDNVTLDYYPSKTAEDSGFIYEDDTQTTAYKLGQFRTTDYSARYDNAQACFVLKIGAANGSFEGARCLSERIYMLKMHWIDGIKGVSEITVNGNAVPFESCERTAAFPFGADKHALDKTVTAQIVTDVAKEYEIKIYVK